jgi:hypothetical protein
MTLIEAILARYDALTPDPTYEEAERTVLATQAAASVTAILGPVGGGDVEAVALGAEFMEYHVAKASKQLAPGDNAELLTSLTERLDALATRRVLGLSDPNVAPHTEPPGIMKGLI